MYVFWYSYVKPKYGKKWKLCYLKTDSFTVYLKAERIYINIAKDVETEFDTSNHELDRRLSRGNFFKNGLMKDKLDRKIMLEFIELRPSVYSYLIDYKFSSNV